MLAPDSCGGSSGSDCAHTSAALRRNTESRMAQLSLVLRRPGAVILVADISDLDPGMRHLVHGALSVADPLLRIGVVRIVAGVVVPGSDLDDSALGQHRRGV